jgi:FkbM family methyltransferase
MIEEMLPEYPCVNDVWDELSRPDTPLVFYGMGNGADKLIDRLGRYGKEVSGVFASDGFVRGHSYKGMRVKSFSEIKAEYEAPKIAVSFASNRAQVIALIKDIAAKNDVYIPDMPVAGDEYFDKDFYNKNYDGIRAAFASFADEESKRLFASLLKYKLTARAEHLFAITHTDGDIYSLVEQRVEVAIDAGAYNGDTARIIERQYPGVKRIYAVEPDLRNFKKLVRFADEGEHSAEIIPKRFAVWSENADGSFSGSGNRNSSVNSTVSHESRTESVPLLTLDSQIADAPDLIKYDVEGAELNALIGSAELIAKYRPALIVSAYHRSEDVFSLVNYIKKKYPFYDLYLRRTECFPAWEIAIVAIENKEIS